MSIFTTQRPANPNDSFDKLVSLTRNRKANYKALEESASAKKEADELKAELDKQDADKEQEDAIKESLYLKSSRRAKANWAMELATMENKLVKENFNDIYNQVLFQIVYESYWMDEDVKEQSDILAMYESFNNIKSLVENCVPMSSNQMLDNIKEAVTEACKKAAKRVVKELSEGEPKSPEKMKEIDFSLTDAEYQELDDDINTMGKEEVIQLVKDKVLSVVQDEKRASKEKQEMFQQINEAEKEVEAELNGESGSNDVPDEGTEATPQDAETAAKESFNAIATRNRNNRIRRSAGATLFEALMMQSNKEISESIVSEGVSVSEPAKASAVFTNTVFNYTVLETLNTIGLYKFDNTNIRNVIEAVKKM